MSTLPPPPQQALPNWVAEQLVPTTPSMSPSTRLDVLMSVDDPYEAFVTGKLTTKSFMICDICRNVLRDPCTCQCTFVACLQCLQLCNTKRCPQCRARLPDQLVPAKHYQNVLDAECKFQGVRFLCNTASPGSDHPCPLWCCNESFDTLPELEEHLRKQGSFKRSRASASSLPRASSRRSPEALRSTVKTSSSAATPRTPLLTPSSSLAV